MRTLIILKVQVIKKIEGNNYIVAFFKYIKYGKIINGGKMKFLKVLLSCVKSKVIYVILFLIFSVLSMYLLTYIPVIISYGINHIIGNNDSIIFFDKMLSHVNNVKMYLLFICLILLVVQGLICIFNYLKSRFKDKFIQEFQYNLKYRLFYHIQELTYTSFYNNSVADLVQKASTDINKIVNFLDRQLIFFVDLFLLIIFVGFRLFKIHYAFLILIFIISLLIVIRSIWYFKKCAPFLNKLIDISNDMYQTLEDDYKNINFIKLNNLEDSATKDFNELSEKNKECYRLKYLYDDKYYAFVMCMSMLNRPLNFILGGILLYFGKITIPIMLVIFDYSSRIINEFSEFHHVLEEFNDFIIAYKRINNLVCLTTEEADDNEINLNNYDIVFDNVTIKLNDKVILKNVNFEIKENEKVFIVGKTGSGKTILFKTLIGFYDYEGSIKLGGVELKEMNKKNIREYVCMILQDSYIYSKTVRDNIKILDQYIPDSYMIDLSKEFMLHDDIVSLKEGYNTMIGKDGIKLSKGQNQRLILTRTFVKPKNIMIFDDSFSAIDNKNKKEILKDLLSKRNNFTKIVVSYDISLAPSFDKILFIDNKEIIMDNHENMLKNEKYKKIYDIGMDKVGDKYE